MVVFVDVDDTLVRSVGAKRIPMPRVIERAEAAWRWGGRLPVEPGRRGLREVRGGGAWHRPLLRRFLAKARFDD